MHRTRTRLRGASLDPANRSTVESRFMLPGHSERDQARARPSLFLLDTSVLSQLAMPVPAPSIVAWLENAPDGALCVTWSVVFELQLGVELAKRRGNRRAAVFEQQLNEILEDRRYQIMLPTVDVARIRATLSAIPALGNFVIPDPRSKRITSCEKLSIAAAAISAGAAIATVNRAQYAEIARCFPLPGIFYPDTGDWDVPMRPSSHQAEKVHCEGQIWR